MIRFMNSSNSGTVNAVSPWLGLQIMPFAMSWLRVGPSLAPEFVGNITRPMRSWSQLRHGSQISLFRWREAIETHAKKNFRRVLRLRSPAGYADISLFTIFL
jgi:hypothetical protein